MTETVGNAPDGGWGWVIVFCSFVIHAISVGTLFSLSVLYVSWLDEFGTSKGVTSWIVSVGVALIFGISPVAVCLASKYGQQAVIFGAGLLSCVGLVIGHFATSVPYLIVSVGVLTGSGFGCGILVSVAVTTVYFNKRRSLALGIGTSGIGIGSFLVAPLFHWLNEEYGWRGTLLIAGAISLHFCVCGLLMRPIQITSVKTTEVGSADNHTDQDQMLQNEHEVMKSNRTVLKSPQDVGKCETFPGATSEALDESSVDHNDPLLSPEKNGIVSKNAKEQNNRFYNHACFEAPTDENAALGGSVPILHIFKATNQTLLARQVSSAMELQSPNFGAHKMYLKLGSAENTVTTLSMRDILMCGSIHSLAFIDGMSRPKTSETASEPETRSSSLCMCSESIAKAFWSLLSSVALLKNGVFAIFAVGSFFTHLTYLMPVLYMVNRALDNGIDKSTAAFLVSLNGAGNVFGRLFFGFLADRSFVDRLVCLMGCLTACGIATSLSPLCGSSAVMHGTYAFTFGSFMGAYSTLLFVVTADLMGVSRLGESLGLLLPIVSVALIGGSPLAGWIFDWTGNFTTPFVLYGLFVLLSAVIMLPIVYIRKCRKTHL